MCPSPELGAWECAAAPWWQHGKLLDQPWTASGPKEWKRVDVADLAQAPRTTLPKVDVTNIHEGVDKISFHVSRSGVPVDREDVVLPELAREGREGSVYRARAEPDGRRPTERDVTLTYGLTPVDWLGRLLTLVGIAGVVFLVRWKGARRYAAEEDPDGHALDEDFDELDELDELGRPVAPPFGDDGDDPGGGPDEDDPQPPSRETPAPALP